MHKVIVTNLESKSGNCIYKKYTVRKYKTWHDENIKQDMHKVTVTTNPESTNPESKSGNWKKEKKEKA